MTKKVLFCATMDVHFKAFHLPYMQWFQEQGWEVHVAANGSLELAHTDRRHTLPIQRSPFRRMNFQAYRELKKVIAQNRYDIIHCHTPMGGVLARLAARKARKQGAKVIYTAHGFHFCKGASLLNWMVYYPIEKLLSRITDCLITINEEDYKLALDRRFKAGRIERVHGVGVDTQRFKPLSAAEKYERRDHLGYPPDDFLMFYAAEFNGNKNQQLLIRALARIKDEAPHARLLLAGEGPLQQSCRELAASLGVGHRVDFLGYRSDIASLLPVCDMAVASSLREGLPVNIMEAMASGLPVVATGNRGHSELIEDQVNGYVVQDQDVGLFAERLLALYRSPMLCQAMGRENSRRAGLYSLERVGAELTGIYSDYLLEGQDEAESKYRRAYI